MWVPGEKERYEAWLRSRAARMTYRAQLERSLAGDPVLYLEAVDRIAALYSPTHFWRVEEEPEFPDSRVVVNQNIW